MTKRVYQPNADDEDNIYLEPGPVTEKTVWTQEQVPHIVQAVLKEMPEGIVIDKQNLHNETDVLRGEHLDGEYYYIAVIKED